MIHLALSAAVALIVSLAALWMAGDQPTPYYLGNKQLLVTEVSNGWMIEVRQARNPLYLHRVYVFNAPDQVGAAVEGLLAERTIWPHLER